MNAHQTRIIELLQQSKGDDTARARVAFIRCTPDEMDEYPGMSGKTRREILADYEKHDAKIDAAIEWVKGVK
jgi:hypothetical protein